MSHFRYQNTTAGVPSGYWPTFPSGPGNQQPNGGEWHTTLQQMLPLDPNPALTAALNRLAAALETFNAGRAK